MALGLKWAALATGVGCSGLALALLPPPGVESRTERPVSEYAELAQRARAVNSALRRAGETLILLERHDSAIASQDTGRVRLVVGRSVSDAWRTWAGRKLDSDARLRLGVPHVPVVVQIAVDTGNFGPRFKGHHWSALSFLVPADSSQACYAFLGLGHADARRDPASRPTRLVTPLDLLDILGPCGFYAAFGPPGPTVEGWLRSGNWELAGGSLGRSDSEGPDVLEWRIRDLIERGRYAFVGCVAGRRRQCRDFIVDYSPISSSTLDTALASYHSMYSWSVGDFLSALLEEQGPEAFARFWRSTEPVDSAFQAAFGAAIGTWTRRWLAERVILPPREVVRTASAPITFALTVVLAAIGVGRIMRRTA